MASGLRSAIRVIWFAATVGTLTRVVAAPAGAAAAVSASTATAATAVRRLRMGMLEG